MTFSTEPDSVLQASSTPGHQETFTEAPLVTALKDDQTSALYDLPAGTFTMMRAQGLNVLSAVQSLVGSECV